MVGLATLFFADNEGVDLGCVEVFVVPMPVLVLRCRSGHKAGWRRAGCVSLEWPVLDSS